MELILAGIFLTVHEHPSILVGAAFLFCVGVWLLVYGGDPLK